MRLFILTVFVLCMLAGCTTQAPGRIDPAVEKTYASGAWTYDFRLEGQLYGKVIGHWGYLALNGKSLGQGRRLAIGSRIDTPWGAMYYFAFRQTPNGPHGWLPEELAKRYARDEQIQLNKRPEDVPLNVGR